MRLRIAQDPRAQAPNLKKDKAFASASDELQRRAASLLTSNKPLTDAQLATLFEEVCLAPHSNFGHYFRTLYYVVQVAIDEGGLRARDYLQVLRAQLSNDELMLLFFNGFSTEGSKSFKSRVEHYGLLKGLRMTPELEQLKTRYQEKAFSDPA